MTETEKKTRGQEVAADVAALLRSRAQLIVLVTGEEARAERLLFAAASSAGYVPRTWDVAAGVRGMDAKPVQGMADKESIDVALDLIMSRALAPSGADRGAWILRDLGPWLQGPGGVRTTRQVRNLARLLPTTPRSSAQALIMVTTSATLPPELSGHAAVVELPLPDRAEVGATLDAAVQALPEQLEDGTSVRQPVIDELATNGNRDAAIDAAVGLSDAEAAACFARSLVQRRTIDPAIVAKEKRLVVGRERVLEWIETSGGGLGAVGGLDGLKSWVARRRRAYSADARAYGLPAPKGIFVAGIPGCGKSLLAKQLADEWRVPLVRADLGALKGKYMGESEGNLRRMFKVVEAIGRCVLLFDEVEKALAGAAPGGGAADGGVAADALGAVLTWMQERRSDAFIVATANAVDVLPPEFYRRGRFDEIFWVDLPTREERVAILLAALRERRRSGEGIDLVDVADACDKFTGAEIASLVPDAMFAAFADGKRELTTTDLLDSAATVTPLATTAAEKVDALRKWADGRARPAAGPRAAAAKLGAVPAIDL